jgi:hypothetical protein
VTFLALAAAVALAASAPASAPSASPPVPTADERTLFEEGRSVERIMLALAPPQIFSIALLRDRALTDLTAAERLLAAGPDAKKFSQLAAEFETLRPFIARGDDSGVSSDLGGGAFFEPYMSKAPPEPEKWWLVEAGMASVDAEAARLDRMSELVNMIHPLWLIRNASYAGRFASLMPKESSAILSAAQPQTLSQVLASPSPGAKAPQRATLSEMNAYVAELSKNLASAFPEGAFPKINFGSGEVSEARRGVAMQTATEILQAPALLGQVESQSFVDSVFASFEGSTTDRVVLDALADGRAQFDAAGSSDEYSADERSKKLNSDLGVYFASISKPRDICFALGSAAAYLYYNASKDRDPVSDASFRNAIGSISELDASIPGLAPARAAVAAAKPGDWLDIRAKNLALIDLIVGPN